MPASASPGHTKVKDHTVDLPLAVRMAERSITPLTTSTTSTSSGDRTPTSGGGGERSPTTSIGGSILSTSSKGLTVDEMLEMYPKQHVEWAIHSPDYVGARNRRVKKYDDMIARGSNVELAARARDEFLARTPSEPPIDPGEPADLDPEVLRRIRVLKYMYRGCRVVRPATILDLDPSTIFPETAVNRDAVLSAYRRGDLNVVPGQATVWFAGNLVAGPLPSSGFTEDYLAKNIPGWREKYGHGHVWTENPHEGTHRQRKCEGTMPAIDEIWAHVFSIRARLIGETDFVTINNILDDTGSSYLELLTDDCFDLGLTETYSGWKPDVSLKISSHEKIKRHSIMVEAQLLLDGEPFGPVLCVRATISPVDGGELERCSGMAFRRNLFTATSPYGGGDLHLSDFKKGVTRSLRGDPQ
ncbi:uncharacterized protein TRUGW13939_03226 [Talaromyces rugulosus]|uniref:Uncharacterized protein n=1 Tax=Talaromyces rugulosus TaxID=121627 RepID=A0A7H8QQK9_TALRU|nr:uncharacterized protein TRUGW13939_03226 [Talaromyces rugulosus]QKX56126.1 hypothetical protein TRUGW13939_03226 [Talaromyces rugulosus]